MRRAIAIARAKARTGSADALLVAHALLAARHAEGAAKQRHCPRRTRWPCRLKSQGRTSPGCMFIRCDNEMLPPPSTVVSSTSASCRQSLSEASQRSSCSARSDCTPESSTSRSGSIIEYGITMCIVPPPPSSSIWNGHTTTTSDGVTMLAKLGLISELRYSRSIFAIGVQASFMSAKALRNSMWTTRISVAVKSRPSIFA